MPVAADGSAIVADTFGAGLTNRRQALAERREKAMTQGQSPFDDGLPDDDDVVEPAEESTAEETTSEEEPPTAPASPQGQKSQKRRGPGRKRRGLAQVAAIEPMAESVTAGAISDEDLPEAAATPVEGGINPKDPLLYWPKIIAAARAKGFGPEYLQIRIERAGFGAHPTPFILVDTIQGEMVCGNESENAGQMLVDYLTDIVHLGRKVGGPANYKLQAFYKIRASGGFPVMTITLEHPDEIRAQQMRKAQYFRDKETPSLSTPAGLPGLGYRGPIPPAQGYQQFQPQPPPPVMPPIYPTVPPVGAGLADTLAQLRAYEEWRQQTIAAGQPAPPPAPQIVHMPPPPSPPVAAPEGPRLSKEEEELIFEAKMNRFIEKAGYVKPGVGAPPTPTAVVATASDPVAAIENLLKTFAKIKGMEKQVGTLFGYEPKDPNAEEEEPEPEKKPDEITVLKIPGATFGGRPVMLPRNTKGTIDFFQQAVMSNLETSQELGVKAIAGVASALDKTSFGKLLESLAQKGGAPAQLAQATKASGIVGTGSVNGATPLPQRPRGPMA
jgi:hypothetical protein